MHKTLPIVGGKGVNFDLPASELTLGFWSAGTKNVRVRAGVDESWDGATLYDSTGSVVPLWGLTYDSGTKRAVYVSSTKAYSYRPSSITEITRYTDGQVISSMTAAGTTVTVNTAAAHGRTTGDAVDVWGCVPTTYNVTNKTITVVDADTFTYTADSAPATSPATVNGAYSYNVAANFTAPIDFQRYTGGAFNGLFLFNHPGDGLYYWSGDTSIRMRKVPGFQGTSAFNVAVAARPFKNYIVVLGKYQDGVARRQNVAWSSSISDPRSLPTSFTSTSTNDAGETNLTETAGAVVDCLPLGDVNIVYLSDARYAMHYIGVGDGTGNAFSFYRLPGNHGVAYPNCVVSTPVGHVFLTPDLDVMIHQGGEAKSIASGRFKRFLRDNMKFGYDHLSFLAADQNKNEVLVCFPSTSTTVCDKALVWNWVEDTVGYFDLASGATSASGVSFATNGQWPNSQGWFIENRDSLGFFCYHATDSAKTGLYLTAETTSGQWFGTDIVLTLIREGIDMGDRDRMKAIHRSRWNIDATAADAATISHGSSKFADTAATYATGVTYTVGTTDYCNARSTQGRFLAIKLVSTSLATTMRVRSIDVDVTLGGTR